MEIVVFSLKLDQIPLTHFYIYFWTEAVLIKRKSSNLKKSLILRTTIIGCPQKTSKFDLWLMAVFIGNVVKKKCDI